MKIRLRNLLKNFGFMYYFEAKGYYQKKSLRILVGIVLFIITSLIRKIARSLSRSIDLDFLEFYITTKCTLNCRDCLVLIPYQRQQHFNLDTLIQDMQKLLELVDRVYQLGLLGGEPLQHPELPAMIRWLEEHPKVKRIGITVNGATLPDHNTLLALKQSTKVIVYISDYPDAVVPQKMELLNTLRKHQVQHRILAAHRWHDFGDYTIKKEKTEKEKQSQFKRCFANHYYGVMDGRLYQCGRSAMIFRAAQLPEPEGNSFEFRKQTSASFLREELKRFLRKRLSPACDYCNDNKPEHLIVPAIQRKSDKIELERQIT